MVRLAPTPQAQSRTASSVPLRHMGNLYAAAGLFLGSDASRHFSGAILTANGGWILNATRMSLGAGQKPPPRDGLPERPR